MATVAATANAPATASPFVTHARLVAALSLRDFWATAHGATIPVHKAGAAATSTRNSGRNFMVGLVDARDRSRFYPALWVEVAGRIPGGTYDGKVGQGWVKELQTQNYLVRVIDTGYGFRVFAQCHGTRLLVSTTLTR